jgi:hypothetical protein
MLVASCALIAALGGVAAAAIPHSTTGVITGCYGPSGNLRVIDAQAGEVCRHPETQLTWNQGGGGAGAGMYAHVRADGTLDVPRSTVGITVTRVLHGSFPVYCLKLPSPAVNVVASLEKASNEGPGGSVSYTSHGINATVDPGVMTSVWPCPSGTDAAVLNTQQPTGGFYAQFE